jgi:hypothetical protein
MLWDKTLLMSPKFIEIWALHALIKINFKKPNSTTVSPLIFTQKLMDKIQ